MVFTHTHQQEQKLIAGLNPLPLDGSIGPERTGGRLDPGGLLEVNGASKILYGSPPASAKLARVGL
jgi:hypothetical protein